MSVSVREALGAFKPAAIAVGIALAAYIAGWVAYEVFFPGTAPVQPIEFSHVIHAGDYQIDCQYCHIYAARSTTAGVPAVEKCMGCHKVIATDKPEIQKLTDYWNSRQAIPWIKVHDLADFVYFSHKRHVQAEVACQTCHGEVQTMARIERVAPLSMKWCVGCHEEREVENGRDCWTCHK